ncbi:TolC family outer membrane protein [Citromicrobium bathyomarinum]|uniref:TolC family outer membrane protein n=1 Tax=Citromicrobium TaxID=72173 RepID=UPI0001DD0890|nr:MULTISPECIES: TolC family outer membrane protein [Citromicrobium]ALG59867.1 membrane protein [Citromicrobium sp. JL477]KPM13994.1 membrane protein [Citromicrobium sp. JL31]KPM17035.1 membrane protein [Citromicrobium sp. JL1351]KPM27368.1 membrane protein [Citromicrobium sp. JL2201]
MKRTAILALTASSILALAAPAYADTLNEALAEAYRSNPTLQAARAQLRATDENVAIEKADGRPSVTGSAALTEVLIQNSTSFFAPARSLSAGVDLGVPIYSGGAVKNSIRAAEQRVEAGRADLRGTESAIFSQVVAAYMDVLRGEALVGLSANQVQVLEVNLRATSDRFEIGDLTRTDVAQSQSRLALARGDLRSAQAGLIQARESYIQLVGSAPGELEPPPPLPNLPDDPRMAVDVALDNNPDLIAARERAQAAGYDIDVAGASRLPRLSAFAGYDYQNFLGSVPDSPTGPSPQTADASSAGLTLSIPIFQGGRPAALQRQAQARASAALDQVIAAERDVIAQVRASYASYSAALAIIDSSREAVAAAELSLEGVRAENSIGNRTVLDVLNAEQELLLARVDLVTARRNAYVAGFSLLAAMGRAEARDLGIEGGALYDPLANYDRVSDRWSDWDRDPEPEAAGTRTVDIPAADAEVGTVYGPMIEPERN